MARRRYRRPQDDYEEYYDDETCNYPQNYDSDEEMEQEILDARTQYSRSKSYGLLIVIGMPLLVWFLTGNFEITAIVFIGVFLFLCAAILGSYFKKRNAENQYRGVISIRDEFKGRK